MSGPILITAVKSNGLGIPLLASVALHGCVLFAAAVGFHRQTFRREELLPVRLVELPRPPAPAPPPKVEAPPEKRPPPRKKVAQPRAEPPDAKSKMTKPTPPAPLPRTPVKEPPISKKEPTKPAEAMPPTPAKEEMPSRFITSSLVEDGGSEAGGGNLFGEGGDVGVVPGAGTRGGGGTANAGLGRGSGAPGLPAQAGPLRTHREAKPIQTARANYPPMALRMGLESDVSLRIEVDSDGKVTSAEIIKSGGSGFDEEALRAVKQSRFEPAQQDGRHVPAEFTYIYRFRLRK